MIGVEKTNDELVNVFGYEKKRLPARTNEQSREWQNVRTAFYRTAVNDQNEAANFLDLGHAIKR